MTSGHESDPRVRKTSPHGERTFEIALPGLRCRSCAKRIELRLGKESSIESVSADTINETLLIELATGPADLPPLLAIVRSEGYDPRVVRARLAIPDFPFCSPGAARIEQNLLAIPAVGAAAIDPIGRSVIIDYLPGGTALDQLREVIRLSGYEATTPRSEDDQRLRGRRDAKRTRNTAILGLIVALASSILSLPLMAGGGFGARLARWGGEHLGEAGSSLFAIDSRLLATGLLALALAAVVVVGRRTIIAGWLALASRNPDRNSLTLLAVAPLTAAGALLTLMTWFGGAALPALAYLFQSALWILAFQALSTAELERRRGILAGETAMTSLRAPSQSDAERRFHRLSPLAIIAATAAFIFWFDAGGVDRLLLSLTAFASVLVVASPQLGGLSFLLPASEALVRASREGILIDDAATLEELNDVAFVVLDSSSVVEGQPSVSDFVLLGIDQRTLLRVAASLAAHSNSSLAASLASRGSGAGSPIPLRDVRETESNGIEGSDGARHYRLGTATWQESGGVDCSSLREELDRYRAEGKTCLVLAIDRRPAGLLALSSTMRESAPAAVSRIRALGSTVVLLTSEERQTAEAAAGRLGVDRIVIADPSRRAAEITAIRRLGRTALVEASAHPLLRYADLAVSMGGGEAAIRIPGGLSGLPDAIELSRQTIKTVRGNRNLALVYHIGGILLGSQILFAVAGVLIPPALFAGAMAASIALVRKAPRKSEGGRA